MSMDREEPESSIDIFVWLGQAQLEKNMTGGGIAVNRLSERFESHREDISTETAIASFCKQLAHRRTDRIPAINLAHIL